MSIYIICRHLSPPLIQFTSRGAANIDIRDMKNEIVSHEQQAQAIYVRRYFNIWKSIKRSSAPVISARSYHRTEEGEPISHVTH